ANAAEMTQEIRGFTQGGQEFGDWKVTVKRLPEGANLDQPSRHPTLDECKAAGQGPGFPHNENCSEGGLPNTSEERERFEAYMRGHCWEVGRYVESMRCYDTVGVRMLYGVWRDRG